MLAAIAALAGVAKAGTQLYAAKKGSTEAKYNAKMKEEQAFMIGEQQGISNLQWDRQIGRAMSTFVQRVGASGIMMSGSPMAAMLDMTTQLEFDKAIDLYNLEWEKRGVQSEADAYRRQSKNIMFQGYANAFSTLLTTGSNYAQSNFKF